MAAHKKIAIVGAGVSGLAAGLRLVENGVTDVTIFEARREPGGRTRSFRDPISGDTLDNGQHLLMGCYTSTIEYIRSLGLAHELEWQPSLSIPFWIAGERRPRKLSLPPLPAPMNLIGGVLQTDLLTSREKFAAIRLGNAIRTSKLPNDLASLTCSGLFQALSQPETLIHKLWEPIVLATMNTAVKDASAEVFVNVMREVFFTTSTASALIFPRIGLTELLIDPAIAKLQVAGVSVKLGTPIRRIESNETGWCMQHTSGVELYDAIIWTAPNAEGLPEEIARQIPDFNWSPIVNAYFWIDRPVLNSPISAAIGTTLQWVFVKSSIYAPQRLALTVSEASELSLRTNQEITTELWEDLKSILIEMKGAVLLHSQIIKEKRATLKLTPELQSQRPGIETGIENFYFAGDLVQNGLPATIEGAVRNGYKAASKLLRMLK